MTRERPDFPTLFLREVLRAGIEPAVLPHLARDHRRRPGASPSAGRARGSSAASIPLLLHFGLVGSLVFFFATEPARRRAAAQGRVPFAMPDSTAFLRYLEELTLRGLAPDEPAAPASRRKGARA